VIRVVVSGIVAAIAGFAVFGTIVNTAMYGVHAEASLLALLYGTLLALAVWSGSREGIAATLLAAALLSGGVFLIGVTLSTGYSNPVTGRWQAPLFLLLLAAALACHQWSSRAKRTATPQNNGMQLTSS
jgi:uncharacterized membrane protein YadS